MGVLEKLLISLGFGFCEWCQKSWYLWLGTKKKVFFFVRIFLFKISSSNSFNKLDSSTWLYMNIHVEKTFKALQCKICGKYFQKNWELFNTCKKSPKVFFGSWSKISRFLTYFTKSKTWSIERFFQSSHYCLQFLRLSTF